MFKDAHFFNQPLNGWNVVKLTHTPYMFAGAVAFNQPLDAWDTRKLQHMAAMFAGASAYNQSINAWELSEIASTAAGSNGLGALENGLLLENRAPYRPAGWLPRLGLLLLTPEQLALSRPEDDESPLSPAVTQAWKGCSERRSPSTNPSTAGT